MLDKTLRSTIKVPGELYFALQDFLVDGHWVLVIERVDPCKS